MSFCPNCGNKLVVASPFCGGCGTPVPVSTPLTDAPPVAEPSALPPPETAASVSATWLWKFALIDKAGGAALTKISSMTFDERLKIRFNIWAYLFAPFYYLAKGMWRKAITLLVIHVVLFMIFEKITGTPKPFTLIIHLLYAYRANLDYYKKIVLKQQGWW